LTSDFTCPVVDDHAGITCVFGLLGELLWSSRALDGVHEDRSAIRGFNGEKNYHGIKGEENKKEKTLAGGEGLFASWGIIYANLRPRSGCIIMCIMVRLCSPQVPKAEVRKFTVQV